MENLNNLSPIDFYYNGHWLSEFGGIIVNENNVTILNIIPEKKIITEPILRLDGEIFIKSFYNARYIEVLVKFEDVTRIREIASWLNAKEPSDFYFNEDKIKLKALNTEEININLYAYEGLVNLNFTAYDPYYYAMEDKIFTFTNFNRGYDFTNPLQYHNAIKIITDDMCTPSRFELIDVKNGENMDKMINTIYYDGYVLKDGNNMNISTKTMQQIEVYNDGNSESYPLYKIKGKGTITIGIDGDETFRIKLDSTGNDYMYIDTYNCTCYKENTNRLNDTDGDFKSIPSGKVLYGIIGECTEFEINCRSRWI